MPIQHVADSNSWMSGKGLESDKKKHDGSVDSKRYIHMLTKGTNGVQLVGVLDTKRTTKMKG